jgi:hypothetical protein
MKEVCSMTLMSLAAQAAAEYGAAAGQAVGGTGNPASSTFIDQGFELVTENPVALVGAVIGLLVVVGLFRTRRYPY